MKADVTTLDAKANGSVDLNEAVFGVAPRADILQRMVTYQLAARQAGTHKPSRAVKSPVRPRSSAAKKVAAVRVTVTASRIFLSAVARRTVLCRAATLLACRKKCVPWR